MPETKCSFIPEGTEIPEEATHDEVAALACQNAATWQIWTPPSPYDVTEACDQHVDAMALEGDERRPLADD